jgi:hypothetical protein
MRYHKATSINKPEAQSLLKRATASRTQCVVVEVFGKWYDVRRMTGNELSDFVEHLHRTRIEEVAAGLLAPH